MDEDTSYIENKATNEAIWRKVETLSKGLMQLTISWWSLGKNKRKRHMVIVMRKRPYSISSYVKGSIFLSQLGYVIGQDNLAKTIKRYYQDFKFKHPTPNDIKRSAERVSELT
jgi:aminopeptidase N